MKTKYIYKVVAVKNYKETLLYFSRSKIDVDYIAKKTWEFLTKEEKKQITILVRRENFKKHLELGLSSYGEVIKKIEHK